MRIADRVRGRAAQLLALRSARGPYRFVVKDWLRTDDLDLAERVLRTDWFLAHLRPTALPWADFDRICVVAPHQDDEVIGAGGLLSLAAEAGKELHIIHLTDGAPRPESTAPLDAPVRDEAVLAERSARRRAEAELVAGDLGAKAHFIDIDNVSLAVSSTQLENYRNALRDANPDLVLLPWLLDSPPAHRFAVYLTLVALRDVPLKCEAWAYQVHNDLIPNGYVDITEKVQAKAALIRRYESQLEHLRRYDHLAVGLAAWNSRYLEETKGATSERFAEVYFAAPLSEYLSIMRNFYFRRIDETFKGDRRVIAAALAVQDLTDPPRRERWRS